MDIKDLAKIASDGKMERRDFMKKAAALGLAAPFATSLLSQSVHAAIPKKGGRYIQGYGHGSTTDSLDPGTYENDFTTGLGFTLFNYLTEVSNTGELIGELAESFESNPAATIWNFKLRKGVQFHNGKTMDADDVIASINHHLGDDSKSAAKGVISDIDKMKKKGQYEIEFTLKNGNADFPLIMSDYHLAIMPVVDGKASWEKGIGTGGYILQNFEPGVRAIFTRNPNYFKSDRAHFDEVEMISLLDTTARQNAIINREVHSIDSVDPLTVHLLGQVKSIDIMETTGTLHYTFPMRVNSSPFDNYDLRKAVKLSVDREQLVKKVLKGHGAIGNDHPISTANRYHNGEMPQHSYDPDKAKFHLKRAGMEGITIDLSTSDAAFAGAVDAALLIKDSAAKSGININVIREPKDGYWTNVWNKKPWCACYWGGRPSEDWAFVSAYTNDTEWNDTAWKTGPKPDRFNRLVKMGRSETNPAKRREIYYECQELLSDDGGALVPMFANYILALDKSLSHHKEIAGNWSYDGNRASERWWFA
jgi:peptide/nickel transport system substrate-binding protein